MRLRDWLSKRSSPAADVPAEAPPLIGITREDLLAALAAIDAVGSGVDRRILRVQVVGEGRMEVSTGHVSGFLNADCNEFVLQRDGSGWRITEHVNIVS